MEESNIQNADNSTKKNEKIESTKLTKPLNLLNSINSVVIKDELRLTTKLPLSDDKSELSSVKQVKLSKLRELSKLSKLREFSQFKRLQRTEKILLLCSDEEKTGVFLAQELEITKAAISQQTSALMSKNLLEKTDKGFITSEQGIDELFLIIERLEEKESSQRQIEREKSRKEDDFSEIIYKSEQFFEHYSEELELYSSEILNKKSLEIDFSVFLMSQGSTAELILDSPEQYTPAVEMGMNRYLESIHDKDLNLKLRFKNLPDSQTIPLSSIRSEHREKFITIVGNVKRRSSVKPHTASARFECPSCGNVVQVLQLDDTFKEPTKCSCGRKGKFKLLSRIVTDVQAMLLEESVEDSEGNSELGKLNVILKDDLCSVDMNKRTIPGSKIIINGILRDLAISTKNNFKQTKNDWIFDAISIELYSGFDDMTITEKDEEEIRSTNKEELFSKFASSLKGHDLIKKAILSQAVGGVKQYNTDGTCVRGHINIILVGDVSVGKSQLGKAVAKSVHRSRFTTATSATSKGLTAAAVKDEFLGGYTLEAGAVALSTKSVCVIDEVDKVDKEELNHLLEAMEQGTISVSKAGVQATLNAETGILALANPKHGRFDDYEEVLKQINLPEPFRSRCDAIFVMRDKFDEDRDREIIKHILGRNSSRKELTEGEKKEIVLLKKYLLFAKNLNPIRSEAACAVMESYAIKMRKTGTNYSMRQVEGLGRLSDAQAKLRLSDVVEEKDVKDAIVLMEYSAKQIGIINDAGEVDFDKLTSFSNSDRSRINILKKIIDELEQKIGNLIPIDDILDNAKTQGIEADAAEDLLEKMKRTGEIFEPKKGFLKRL